MLKNNEGKPVKIANIYLLNTYYYFQENLSSCFGLFKGEWIELVEQPLN